MTETRKPRLGWRVAIAMSALAVLLAPGALRAPGAAAQVVPNPDETLIALWEPCEPETGVTIVVDRFARLGDGKVYVRCALGPQPNGWAALQAAGFEVEGLGGGVGFACRIDGEPQPAEEPCLQTPGADRYWSYWHGKPGGRWGYSGVGAANPMSAAPVDAVQGWAFGGSPRIEPMNGSGPSGFQLPPVQESSTMPAALARDWLTPVVNETAAGAEAGEVTPSNDDLERLLTAAVALARAGVEPPAMQPLAEWLARSCEVEGVPLGGCALRGFADPDAVVTKRLPERFAPAVLGVQALGRDPSSFAGMDLRGALAGLIDEATGKVQRQAKLQDAVEFTAPTVLALARTGPLPEKALKTIDLILAKQDAVTGAFAVLTTAHAQAIQALAAARDALGADGLGQARFDAIAAALPRAGEYLAGIQAADGGVRRRANLSATHDPNLESTAAGAVGLALAGRGEESERAAKWVSRFQVTAEYAGVPDPAGGGPTPAEEAIGAFLPGESALRSAIAFGVPSTIHGSQAEAQLPTVQALLALLAAGPYGPLYATLDPPSLRFESQATGSRSDPLAVVLANRDVRPAAIGGATLSGEAAADFGVAAGECAGATLAPGESCELSLSFAPLAAGIREALVRVALDGGQELALPVGGSAVPGPEPELGRSPEPDAAAGPVGGPPPKLVQAPAAIVARRGVQAIGAGRMARIATLSCAAPSPCIVRTPWRVRLLVAGRYYGATVIAPERLGAGERGALRVRLARRAFARLGRSRPTLRVKVRIFSGGQATVRAVRARVGSG